MSSRSTKKFKNGIVYKGDLVKDKRHGKGQQEWPDGRMYDGDFAEDMISGFLFSIARNTAKLRNCCLTNVFENQLKSERFTRMLAPSRTRFLTMSGKIISKQIVTPILPRTVLNGAFYSPSPNPCP